MDDTRYDLNKDFMNGKLVSLGDGDDDAMGDNEGDHAGPTEPEPSVEINII